MVDAGHREELNNLMDIHANDSKNKFYNFARNDNCQKARRRKGSKTTARSHIISSRGTHAAERSWCGRRDFFRDQDSRNGPDGRANLASISVLLQIPSAFPSWFLQRLANQERETR